VRNEVALEVIVGHDPQLEKSDRDGDTGGESVACCEARIAGGTL
jgi:hypothetical protein